VGTCSMRRIVQLKATRPDLEILDDFIWHIFH
jgi:porphobilinogen deaminase